MMNLPLCEPEVNRNSLVHPGEQEAERPNSALPARSPRPGHASDTRLVQEK